ncbi:aspartate:alanine exchanger family transporter [Janthinobacterium lividum]|uniref:aspartate:alanine exchanger family transporter n=1 Tax=Janthinobacterium lividum TaxID=29581 RepID=UPI001B83BB31|nr:TrkA C-terminal domain-containing protein [Janthinobacterium lividum]MBR7635072.1 YidE/YbjL duplication [Janthinobacterium lividum]
MLQLFRHTLESTPILALFLVIGAGYALGRISVFGFSLGVGGVLFAGLALGAFAPGAVPPPMVGSIGLLLFLYGIGVQYGVQFFAGLRGVGQKHNVIAFIAVMGGLAVSVWGGQWIDISLRMASGVFAGAMTSTAALQAALEASHGNGDAAVGYAVAYPFGVVGPMLGLYLAGRILKPVLTPPPAPIVVSEITIDAATLAGAALSELADGPLAGVQVIGVRQGHQNRLPDPGLVLGVGDALMVSGTVAGVEAARTALGHLDPGRLMKDRSAFDGTEVFVSDAEIVGVPLGELNLAKDFPLQIAFIRRGDAMILPHPFLTLEFGDRVMAIAPPKHAADVRKLFGNSITATAEFSYVSLGMGMVLGVLLGLVPIPLPWIGSFSLGLAGGPLVMALILGRLGRVGRISWRLPLSANLVMRNYGLTIFLASVGMASGLPFVQQVGADGLPMLALGAVTVLVVVALVVILGKVFLRLPFPELLGIAAGATGNPAVLVFANRLAKSDRPNLGYAMIFPSMTIVKIVAVQVLLHLYG